VGLTLFEINYGYTLIAYNEPKEDKQPAQSTLERTRDIKDTHKQLEMDIKFFNVWIAKYYN
jgi:hypothetical protein